MWKCSHILWCSREWDKLLHRLQLWRHTKVSFWTCVEMLFHPLSFMRMRQAASREQRVRAERGRDSRHYSVTSRTDICRYRMSRSELTCWWNEQKWADMSIEWADAPEPEKDPKGRTNKIVKGRTATSRSPARGARSSVSPTWAEVRPLWKQSQQPQKQNKD